VSAANARLIAAATDLVEALRALLPLAEIGAGALEHAEDQHRAYEALQRAQDVLARATADGH